VKLRFAVPLVWVAFTAATPSGQPQRFALAIVRLDGAIVPFAAFNGGRWERAWPEADEATESAGTIDGTPSVWSKRGERVPRVWTVWPATGARSIQAQVTGIQVADAHCGGQVALKTNLRSVKMEHPAKFGVAVDSNVPMGAVEEINESNSAWKGRTSPEGSSGTAARNVATCCAHHSALSRIEIVSLGNVFRR